MPDVASRGNRAIAALLCSIAAMKPGLTIGLLAVLAGTASAEERSTSVNVGGIGIMQTSGETDDDFDLPILEAVGGIRGTLSWETRPLPYPDQPGYNVGVALVPELIAGALVVEDSNRAEGLLGAGVRGELKIAQFKKGLLKISAKGSIYLAARGMVVGKDRDVILEGVFGEYIYLGNRPLRLGFELGVTRRYSDVMDHDAAGGLLQVYLGWSPY